jgi:hypothetical protein
MKHFGCRIGSALAGKRVTAFLGDMPLSTPERDSFPPVVGKSSAIPPRSGSFARPESVLEPGAGNGLIKLRKKGVHFREIDIACSALSVYKL